MIFSVEQGRQSMSARKKINHAFVNGSLLMAGLAGLATGSWAVFAGVLAVSVALNLYSGNIRPTAHRNKR